MVFPSTCLSQPPPLPGCRGRPGTKCLGWWSRLSCLIQLMFTCWHEGRCVAACPGPLVSTTNHTCGCGRTSSRPPVPSVCTSPAPPSPLTAWHYGALDFQWTTSWLLERGGLPTCRPSHRTPRPQVSVRREASSTGSESFVEIMTRIPKHFALSP